MVGRQGLRSGKQMCMFHQLAHCPRLKQEPGTPSGTLTWVAGAQVLGPSSAAFPCGAGSKVKQLKPKPVL